MGVFCQIPTGELCHGKVCVTNNIAQCGEIRRGFGRVHFHPNKQSIVGPL